MQTKVFNLKRGGSKLFVADETFWNNVNYITFHGERLEIRLKRGRPTYYLHYWLFKAVEDSDYNELEKQRKYEEIGCSYRFPKENDNFLDFLYEEARKRGVLEYNRG